jgi:hypothetical protein
MAHDGNDDDREQSGKVIDLRSKLPPHFFTDKVVANRTAPTVIAPTPISVPYKEKVRCKIGTSKRFGEILLHMDPLSGEFRVSSPTESWSEPVERAAIVAGLSEAIHTTWARVKTKVKIVTLDRTELRHAFNTLEGKLKKRHAS